MKTFLIKTFAYNENRSYTSGFRSWLMNEAVNKKVRLCVFDFDGTIANTPERPLDRKNYRGWDGRDWWGSKASLSSPHYDGNVNEEVVKAFQEAKSDPNTYTVMLTGRRGVVAPHVREVLRKNELYGRRVIGQQTQAKFQLPNDIHPNEELPTGHEEYYVGDHTEEPDFPTVNGKKGPIKDGSTFAHKSYVVTKLVEQNGSFETVEIWDDRKDHIEMFKALAQRLLKEGKVQNFVIHQVYPPYAGAKANIVHMPITLDTSWRSNH